MKKRILFSELITCLLMAIWAAPAPAVNTVTVSGNVISITAIDSDWSWDDDFPNHLAGLRISSIQFVPGADDDRAIIEEGDDSGPEAFDSDTCSINQPRIKYFNGTQLRPVLDFDAGTYSTGAKVIIIIGN